MQRTGDLKLIQELNRSIILKTIQDHGPISRSEIAETNLEAKIKRLEIYPVNKLTGKRFIDYLLKSIGRFLEIYSDLRKCIGISVTSPGIISVDKAVIHENTKLKLKNTPLKEIIEKQFKLKVWLENDTNAIVLT